MTVVPTLADRTALVTGAGSGIGAAIAEELARAGAYVLVQNLRQDTAATIAQGIRAAGGAAGTVGGDVSNPDDVAAIVDGLARSHARVDVLVNKAGLQHVAPLKRFPLEQWDRLLGVLLTGPFLLTQAVLPSMRHQACGRIINIASVQGKQGSVGKAAYCAAKHGLIGLTRVAALETATDGITVNAICPGLVDTPFIQNQLADLTAVHGLTTDEAAEALGRLVLGLPGLELDGITTFRTVIFPGAAGRSRDELGREEGELMVDLAERLRAAGLPIRTVGVEPTATALPAATVPGVTEVRAGTYVFGDALMATWGAVAEEVIALSIPCTVVSRPTPERATVDGGSKTFAGDVAPGMEAGLTGYGRTVGADAHIEGMTEEHGLARLGPGVAPFIGDRLCFIPNHVCTAVNLADEIVGVRDGRVEAVWSVLARGKRT